MIIINILLWILKIAGILLLAVLGLLILGLLIVLFVPIRYELEAQGDIKEPEKVNVRVAIRYFFRLIRFRAVYENKNFHWEAGIAWKKIGKAIGEELEEPKQEAFRQKTEETGTSVPEPKAKQREETRSETVKEPVKTKQRHEKTKTENKEKEKQRFPERIKYTFQKMCDKIKSFSDQKERITSFLKDETHQAAFAKGKDVVFCLLKKWMPRKMKGFVEYGFDDPYYTGKVLAWLAVGYPFFGPWIQIVPDFEKAALKGELSVRGHFRINHLVAAVIKLVADKNIRSTGKEILRLIKRQKKEES